MNNSISPVVKLAQTLIQCSSVTPHDAGCQTIIGKRLKIAGFECESMRFEKVDNLWARIGQQAPLMVFAGHTDVVPAGPEDTWDSPPFHPEVREGHLYGRGATDMKGALAAMVVAAESFLKAHPHFNGSIGFLITSDEEGPSIHGTQKVMETLKKRGEKINYCLIGEPSSDKIIGDQVRVGRRGSLHGKVIVHGVQGHVAHPHLAKNPIHLSMQVLHELAHTTWDNGNKDFPPTTFQITNINSGTGAGNVIPGHLEAMFNFRYSTAVTVDNLRERTEHFLRKHGLNFKIDWNVGAEPFLTNHGKLITAIQQAVRDVAGQRVRLSTGGGTSDGRFITPTGAEVVELGTLHSSAHQVNENVPIEDLNKLVLFYEKILENILVKS